MIEAIPSYYVENNSDLHKTLFNVQTIHPTQTADWRDGVVVRASASSSVDLGFIPYVESYQKTLKNDIHSFPVWRSAYRDSVENKPASLLVSLGKALNGMPPFLCGGNSLNTLA